jgi:type II secretory pathway predicted ATPase ExeA
MYQAYFGLQRLPFPYTPDPTNYFPIASHDEAFEHLQQFIREGEGFAVVSGAAGVGKTLLAHRLLDVLTNGQQPIFLTNPHGKHVADLFQAVLYDLSLPFEGTPEQELRLRLTDYIMERFAQGERTILIIDEAQHLSADQFEELRLLTNLESRRIKAVQVVLLGQPLLTSILDRPGFEPLAQRIGAVLRLKPLTNEECLEYIHGQITRAGGDAESIISADGLAEICERVGGVPRRINQLTHRALALAFLNQCASIDAEIVTEAAEQLFLPRSRRSLVLHHTAPVFPENERPKSEASQEIPVPESEKTHVVEVGAGDSETIELHAAAPGFAAFGGGKSPWPNNPRRA